MLILELQKLKRSKLNIIILSILLLNIILMYFLGTLSFNDHTYGDTANWYFEQNLILNSCYLFLPVFTLVGFELFLLEKHNKTYMNLLSLPFNVSQLIIAKLVILFIICISYTGVLFGAIAALEFLKQGHVEWHYISIYIIHCIISYIIVGSIILLLLYFNQSMMAGIMISFMLAFISNFIVLLKYAWLYPVNGMFYLSNAVPSTSMEKIGAVLVVLCLIILNITLSKRLSRKKLIDLY